MNPTLSHIFTLEEIFGRLGQKQSTGYLHIFTQRESANIFFKEGVVVAAAKGLVEGEEVLKQALEWKDVHTAWLPEISTSNPPLKVINVPIVEFLAKHKPAKSGSSQATPLPAASVSSPKPSDATAPVQLTATKNVGQAQSARSAQEEALLKKHRLVLISVDDPQQRLKIERVSCLVGRNPACDIPLNHASISRQHCLMQITDRGLHVKDLGTTNGTRVNGIVMTEGYISVGDKLTMGHLAFTLEKEAI